MLTQQFKYSISHSPMHREKYYLFRNNNLHSSVRHKQLLKCSNGGNVAHIHIMAVQIYINMIYIILLLRYATCTIGNTNARDLQ